MSVRLDKTLLVHEGTRITFAAGRRLYVLETNGSLDRVIDPNNVTATETLAAGFADEALTVPVAQPLAANTEGQFDVWFAADVYDIYVPADVTNQLTRWQPAGGVISGVSSVGGLTGAVSLAGIGVTALQARADALESGHLDTLVTKEAPVNPMHPEYGALFDDSTDDTAALNAARAAIPASGGEMLIPPGAAIVNPSVKFNLKSNMTLIGHGEASVLKMKPNSATAAGIFSIIHQVDSNLIENVTIRDVTLDGNRSSGNHGLSEDITGLHLSHPQGLLIDGLRARNLRSEGIIIATAATPVNQPRDLTIVNGFIADCGKKEPGDSGNTRQGIAVLAATGFEIAAMHIADIGSIGIDLEANNASQVLSHGSVHDNHLRDCADWFINVDPFSVATGFAISVCGNTGRGASTKGILAYGTGLTISGNQMLDVLDIGIQIVSDTPGGGALAGSLGVVVAQNVIKTTRSTQPERANVYIDNSTFCIVRNNILLGTAGTAGVKESGGASNDNQLGPNIIENATPYTTVGSRTSTPTTLRESFSVDPASGNAIMTLDGAAGFINNTTGHLTFIVPNDGASEMFFQRPGTEYARFAVGGNFAMQFAPKWAVAGLAQTTVGAAGGASALPATPTKFLKVIDSTGATLVIPAYTA